MTGSRPDSLQELQLLFMDHEKTIETMSEIIRRQEDELRRLTGRLEALENRLKDMAEHYPSTADGESGRPPHY